VLGRDGAGEKQYGAHECDDEAFHVEPPTGESSVEGYGWKEDEGTQRFWVRKSLEAWGHSYVLTSALKSRHEDVLDAV
jgi:hypothetical protein